MIKNFIYNFTQIENIWNITLYLGQCFYLFILFVFVECLNYGLIYCSLKLYTSFVKLIGKIIRAGQHLFRNNYIIWDLATFGTMKEL